YDKHYDAGHQHNGQQQEEQGEGEYQQIYDEEGAEGNNQWEDQGEELDYSHTNGVSVADDYY
ncbi:unnamed protein product, partial [Heterosigma akashiwo]